MAKRKTKKYHKKRNTYKRRQTYKRRKTYKQKRKRTNRKKLTGGGTYAAKAANATRSFFGVTPKINYNDGQLSFFKKNFQGVEKQKAKEDGKDVLGINYNEGDIVYKIEGTIYGAYIYTQASFNALKRACGADCQGKEPDVTEQAAPVAAPVQAAPVQAAPVTVQAASVAPDTQLLQQLNSKLKELELTLGNQVKNDLEDLRGSFVSALNTLNSRLVGDISKINTGLVAEINKINAVLEEHSDKMLHPQAKNKLNKYFQGLNKTLEELKNKQAKLETSLKNLETSQSSTSNTQSTEDFSNLLGLTSQPVATQVVQPVAQPVAPQPAPQLVAPKPVAQSLPQVAPQPVSSQPMDLSFMR
jgi:hypothetical protein